MQNLSGSNIGEDASNVRNNLRALALTEVDETEREAGRTEVLPVQWRKHLNLDVRPSPFFSHPSTALHPMNKTRDHAYGLVHIVLHDGPLPKNVL